jgi:uncharacterized protein DUF2513
MKRDMDLIRLIMIEIEKNLEPMTWVDVVISGHSYDEIVYHIMLLYEKGLVDANDCSSSDGMDWKAKRLTFDGHEFLDAARSDTVWKKAKERVLSTTGTLTLEALKMALPLVIRQMLTS